MAQSYIAKGEDKTAEEHLEKAVSLGRKHKLFGDLGIIYQLLAQINARKKDFG